MLMYFMQEVFQNSEFIQSLILISINSQDRFLSSDEAAKNI
jgi:hypothetical protein